jgi:hypothetical protein
LLIYQHFEHDPKNLWITLLKTCSRCPESLEKQAFQQIAHAMGKIKITNEINDLQISGELTEGLCVQADGKVGLRVFVHKSRVKSQIFCKKRL